MLGQLAMPDPSLNHNCDPLKTDDQGCGVKSLKNGDYGHAYNAQGGGGEWSLLIVWVNTRS